MGVEVPFFVTLKVTEASTAVRGDTATNITKPVTLETGAVVQVPAFVNEGDMIRVDTRTGEYLERAK
jgi:elongation factor P